MTQDSLLSIVQNGAHRLCVNFTTAELADDKAKTRNKADTRNTTDTGKDFTSEESNAFPRKAKQNNHGVK